MVSEWKAIRTRRFLLRDFVDDDLVAYERYHADPRFGEYDGDEAGEAGHARRLVERFQTWAAERPRRNYQLAVIRSAHPPVLVGCAGLRCADAPQGAGEIGIEMAPEYWGRYGYAGEVLAALAEFGFRKLGLDWVYGQTVSANSRVGRVMSAIGARAMERPTPPWMSAKGWHQLEWRLTREEWTHSRLARRWSAAIRLV